MAKKPDLINAAELSSIGLTLVFSTFIGLGIGYFLDKLLGTAPYLLLIFLILGIVAGFVNLFRAVRTLGK